MIMSSLVWAWVRALNCLQNSMMLTPCWPSAGPMGGDGLALPAGTWSLMNPLIFFILLAALSLRLLYLGKIQLDGRRSPEDGDIHAHLLLFGLHLDHSAGEVRERAIDHSNGLRLLERHPRL